MLIQLLFAHPPMSLPCSQVMLWLTRLSGSLRDPDPPATATLVSPPAFPPPPLVVVVLGGFELEAVLPAVRKNCFEQAGEQNKRHHHDVMGERGGGAVVLLCCCVVVLIVVAAAGKLLLRTRPTTPDRPLPSNLSIRQGKDRRRILSSQRKKKRAHTHATKASTRYTHTGWRLRFRDRRRHYYIRSISCGLLVVLRTI